jgi:hypothetical protein
MANNFPLLRNVGTLVAGIIPRWEPLVPNAGFDGGATPSWMAIAYEGNHGDTNIVSLVNGAGMDVRVRNPGIIEVEEGLTSPAAARVRDFKVTGLTPGVPTFIEVFLTKSETVPLARLEVVVKPMLELKIAFRFATGELSGMATSANELVAALNRTFVDQAKIRFEAAPALPIHHTRSLGRVLEEQRYPAAEKIRPTGKWLKLVSEGDPGANFNVFFLPWDDVPQSSRPSQMIVLERDIVCDEAMPPDKLKIALPHMIGYMLGCQPTSNDKRKDHLMHSSRAKGDATSRIGFIPKDCVNTMNPT